MSGAISTSGGCESLGSDNGALSGSGYSSDCSEFRPAAPGSIRHDPWASGFHHPQLSLARCSNVLIPFTAFEICCRQVYVCGNRNVKCAIGMF
jgi:hypothetical protein